MNQVVGVLRPRLIPEVMEIIGRDRAEDRERQGRKPSLPPDNNQQTAARFQIRGQNGENVRIRQAFEAMRIRPIARIESLSPAAARMSAPAGLPLTVVVVMGSLPA
jgi:hypothetical protein